MKRLRLRKPFRILLCIIAIILVVTLYFPIRSVVKLMFMNYSLFSSIEIYKKDLFDEVIKNDYSEVINKGILDEDFNIDNFDSYMLINYHNQNNFFNNVNKMLELKYSVKDINKINDTVSEDFISKIILKEYVYDIGKYLDVSYFKEKNFDRYKAYFNGRYDQTVLYVNIGIDKEYYTDVNYVLKFSNTMLINKYNAVSEDFVVPDLIKISDDCSKDENYLSKEAAEAFEKMCNAAKEDGFEILANSTYRSYDDQQATWDKYLALYGQSYNDRYVTKPGFSEHHTGLAVDVKSANSNIFKQSKEYTWTIENCYKYGFIHRYQESKVNITGISSEAWHFRYVGVDVATYIYENNLSFEEYYAMFLDK